MNFAQAMERVLAGYRVRRRDWGRALFITRRIVRIGPQSVDAVQIVMRDGQTNVYSVAQCDIFADDWEQVT